MGTGSGKTLIALSMSRGTTMVIPPKQQKLDRNWEKDVDKFGVLVDMSVVSKEEFRRDVKHLPRVNTLIVDEAHHFFSGVQPDTCQRNGERIPKTSQLFDSLLWYIRFHKPDRVYFLTATPVSKPMNVYAIAKLFGVDWDFWKFRSKYYIERKMGYRSIWIPRTDEKSKNELVALLKRFGTTGQLSDWFDVPPQTQIAKYFPLTKEQDRAIDHLEMTEADPMTKRTKKRQIENGILYTDVVELMSDKEDIIRRGTEYFKCEKMDYILEKAEEFPKMLIFANYTAQVEEIAKRLREKGYNAVTLTGQTKDRKSVVSNMESAKEGILIAQASISEGYELKSVPVAIFASLSNRVLHEIQGRGRLLRSDAIKANLFIYLVTKGGADEEGYKSIRNGKDFQERMYEKPTCVEKQA